MKNRAIVLLITGLVLAMGLVSSSLGKTPEIEDINSGNLVLNPGFETLKEGKPSSWKEDKRGGWKVSEEDPYDGERAMQATVPWGSLSQEVKAEAEESYVLRAYVKSDITIVGKEDSDNTFLTLECLNWRKKVIRKDYGIVSATASWQKKIRQIYTPKGTRTVRIKLAKRQGEGSVWFDDIKLIKVVSGLVANGSFEALEEGKPSSWKEDGKGGWKVSEEDPFDAERCIEATVPWSFLSQEVRVIGEKSYTFRAYVKSDITIVGKEDSDNTFLTLECLNWRKKIIREDYGIVSATASWQPKTRQIYSPKGTRTVRIKLAKRQGEGSVWFDKIDIVETPLPTVLNPGFEILSGQLPDAWTEDPKRGWEVSEEEPYEGENCVGATQSWSWLWQDVPVKPKKWYILEVQVRSDITFRVRHIERDYENTFVTVECLDKDDRVIRREWGTAIALPLWHKRETSVYTPQGVRKIRVKLAKRIGEGTVWFDNVRVRKSSWLEHFSPQKLDKTFRFTMYGLVVVSFLVIILKRALKSKSREDT